jgi:hypothetical protein
MLLVRASIEMFIRAMGVSVARYPCLCGPGFVGGIPVADAKEELCFFLRLIYRYFKPAQLICPLIAKRGQITIYIGLSTCRYKKYSV